MRMAEALLEVVLGNLNTLIQKELATFWGVDGEIDRLSSTLSAIRAVLTDAEVQQTTNHSLKDWIQKLTDAAYVLDDSLDECSIRAEISDSSLLHPQNVLFRFKISKKLKKISERLDRIAEERQQFHLREVITPRRAEVPEWRQTISLVPEPKVYGREEDREKIVEFLVEHARHCDDLSIYPIVGTGGVGKTTLAQLVFNDERVSHSFDFKIWVCVSDDFSIRKIMESIIDFASRQNFKGLELDASNKIIQPKIASKKSFKALLEHNYYTSNLELLQNQVRDLLQNKKYLLVLDDVWDKIEEEWERLKCVLQCGLKGSSILVTTRLASSASLMGTVHPAHDLSYLSEDDCWLLFKQHAFGPDREESVNLVTIGQAIVKRCRGLPLAAKALGSLLRFKFTENEWLHIRDSEFWNSKDDRILPALQLSYFNLDIKSRRCFAFCAIYPKDREIMKEEVIHLWMANGFISSHQNLEVEDVGNQVWTELYQKSIFEVVKLDEWGNVRSFKMHDLIHDLAQLVMGDECVVTDATNLANLPRNIHHIGCLDSDKMSNIRNIKKVESLRTFFLLDFDLSGIFFEFQRFRSLRAMHAALFKLHSFKHLIHLRYLNLQCDRITSLPESICNLRKLQTLKLTCCYDLRHLPQHLTQLHDLRHLVIEDCSDLFGLPPDIGKLTCLNTLSLFIVGLERGHRLAELRDLQLRGKLHIKGLENVRSELEAKEANLVGKKDLDCLYLSWGMHSSSGATEVGQVLEGLQPHSNLKSLGIEGYEGMQLPHWMANISFLKGLVVLILYNCKNCQQPPALGKLSCLKKLYICGMKHVQHIDDSSYDYVADKAFSSLEELSLHDLPNLERMVKDEAVEMFPCLRKLIVLGVPKLTLPCIPSVEHLDVDGCNDDKLMSISNYPNLKFLSLGNNEDLISLPEEITRNLGHLKRLRISDFRKLKAFEHINLSELEELLILECYQLESFLLQGLTSLESLLIRDCPELEVLPNDTNQLTVLRQLIIIGGKIPKGLEHFPSLLHLEVSWIPNITSLPDCLGDMLSLQSLKIKHCYELRSLPSSFPRLTNLEKLCIRWCPKLEKRCKKKTGEEWHKIQHIPQIQVGEESEMWTVSDNIRLAWKKGRRLIHNLLFDSDHHQYSPSDPEFDRIVEEL